MGAELRESGVEPRIPARKGSSRKLRHASCRSLRSRRAFSIRKGLIWWEFIARRAADAAWVGAGKTRRELGGKPPIIVEMSGRSRPAAQCLAGPLTSLKGKFRSVCNGLR
jgi:hypothetical protein